MSAESAYCCSKCGFEWDAIPPSECPSCAGIASLVSEPSTPTPELTLPDRAKQIEALAVEIYKSGRFQHLYPSTTKTWLVATITRHLFPTSTQSALDANFPASKYTEQERASFGVQPKPQLTAEQAAVAIREWETKGCPPALPGGKAKRQPSRALLELEQQYRKEYEQELESCDKWIKWCKDQGDTHGVNFHQGKRSAAIFDNMQMEQLLRTLKQSEDTTLLELVDGAYEIVELWRADSPSQQKWKTQWLAQAKAKGAKPL